MVSSASQHPHFHNSTNQAFSVLFYWIGRQIDVILSLATGRNRQIVHTLHLKISRSTGQQTIEFAAALTLIIGCVLIPLIDAGIIPVRFALAQSGLDSLTQQLARTEKLSEAYAMLKEDTNPNTIFKRVGGVSIKDMELSVEITSEAEPMDKWLIYSPQTIPAEWLPNGDHCPCNYQLNLLVKAQISPLFLAPSFGKGIPGLTSPLPVDFRTYSNWENLGRNPVTHEYFINE